ncbi:MAG TPA: tRNA-guanine transglycosylase, partial [Candidatus Binatus sp.]|nr:tRNA-guanine transglycosylase [Candidatus Binatus sp.]
CDCQCCRQHSRAYIHHLIKSDEWLGWHLLGIHNLAFYHRLMREVRARILAGDFPAYYQQKRLDLMRSDENHPARPPKKPRASDSARLGDFELHRSAQGFYSIRQTSSGEIMHSVTAPSEEANKLYIEQAALATRLIKRHGNADELVIWDVGLGAAANAMAAIHCFETCYTNKGDNDLRAMRLISFERDLDPLLLAARHPGCFPHLRHGAPSAILAHGNWQHASSLLHWELLKGDFRDFIGSAKIPGLIFYDPFSYKTDAELWTGEVFARIFARCRAKPSELYTYSASTAVRVALLSAGFFVAQGVAIGPKTETTIAFNRAESVAQHPLKPKLLEQRWLARWRRSDAQFPATITPEERARFATLIENHRQFVNSG